MIRLLLSIVFSTILIPIFGKNSFHNATVDSDFGRRIATVTDPAVTGMFDGDLLQGDTLDLMKFLYAYMPLPDMVDNSPEFFLENVALSLQARHEMPWGEDIPVKEFMHFVVPVRVNNENLDTARSVFFEELKERVAGLTIEEAILETNHWCHEKVTYRPSDARTSSPLSSVSQAIGRCGEESTFTVAALRSIGIPARQVYTPRWAHTDDNHAWVEAYANGRWHFLGACEPEAVLDLGWFNEPASRGILMTTNVFGLYPGPEEILAVSPGYTTINVTPTYAPVADIKVKVTDTEGNPVPNAKMNFCVYNYAEFYPVASKVTDTEGYASLLAGRGDMLAWAASDSLYGFSLVNASAPENIVVLDKTADWEGEFSFLVVPPAKASSAVTVDAEMERINQCRLAAEDSIRNAYTSTFLTPDEVNDIAVKLGIDSLKALSTLGMSRGNHIALTRYLTSLTPAQRQIAIALLGAVSEKDLRDIPVEVIDDHIHYTVRPQELSDSIWIDYILNPRVENEYLTPYKKVLRERFPATVKEGFLSTPANMIEWVKDSIQIETVWNPRQFRMSPEGVVKSHRADPLSRNIFFVALARSMGVPARIDAVTGEVAYLDKDNNWQKVLFEDKPVEKRKGTIKIDYRGKKPRTPRYYSNFSLSRLDNLVPRQLEFDENASVDDINALDKQLDEGSYLILSGQRLADGGVLAEGRIFNLLPNTLNTVPLEILQDTTRLQVIGSVDAETLYHDINRGENRSLLSTAGRGYYIVGIIGPNDEPSTHILNDISAVSHELDETGRSMILLFENEDAASLFNRENYPSLPANLSFGTDIEGRVKSQIVSSLNLEKDTLPLLVVADSFNRIVYVIQGYSIGTGSKLVDTLHQLAQ